MLTRLETALEPAAGGLEKFCKYLSAAGMVIFMIMVALTFADVFLRYFFNNSLNGTVEVTELFMVIVVFPPWPIRSGQETMWSWTCSPRP